MRAPWATTVSTTRSAAYCFELCQTTNGQAAQTGNHLRRPFRLGIKPTRFRVRIRNRNQLGDASPAGEAGNLYNLNVVIGKPGVNSTTGDMDGTWSATPLEILPAANLAAGAEAVSGWIDAATYPIEVDELNMLGYSFLSGNTSGSQVCLSGGFSFRDNTPANLKVLSPSAALTRSDNASFLQVIIEYEHTDAQARHLLIVGNSLSGPSANGLAAPTNLTNVGEMGTYHQIWAQANRCAATSIAVAGSYASHYLSGNARWDLFDGFNIPYVPDMVMYFAAASSDIADCTSASTSNDVKTNIRNVIRRGRAKYPTTTRQWWANVPPRTAFTGSNATNTTNEYWRTDLNSWMHNTLPLGISGVVDIDEVLTDRANPARLRAEFTTEGTHWTVRAHQNAAEKIPLRRNG